MFSRWQTWKYLSKSLKILGELQNWVTVYIIVWLNLYERWQFSWLLMSLTKSHFLRWVLCYVKNRFWARISTTQRSKSMNAYFDSYVHSKTSLKQFIELYENVLRNKAKKETRADATPFQNKYLL